MADPVPPTSPQQAQPQQGERVVSDQDKALAKEWMSRIEAAIKRTEAATKRFATNRQRLQGKNPDAEGKPYRTNLFFSNLASMRPQVYAKDPEFAVKPRKGVPEARLKMVQGFCDTAEALLQKLLVEDARLKKRTKRQLTAAYTTAVGWTKAQWQEDTKTDTAIIERMKDTQDNINKVEALRAELDDPSTTDHELKLAELQQTLAGLESQSEVTVWRGPVYDFVKSEDVIILDESVEEVQDYPRADAMAHRVWMTPQKYKAWAGYEAKKAKRYKPKAADGSTQDASGGDQHRCLLCVYEVWDQTSNRVLYVCDGEEGFVKPPMSPDWTGRQWYPFFLMLFNEVDGAFYPQSDVELITQLVNEYNTNRDDLVRDRKFALPLNVVRKGGALTPTDVTNITNRQGSDVIVVEGNGGKPIGDDIYSGTLGNINPTAYDTAPARGDIEQTLGGGDASRGTVTQAKTATEAEILAQGLRSRSSERTDITEDMLSDVGAYVLEMCLRKMTEAEVREIAGEEAVWPQMTADQIFRQVSVRVQGGSTGKPDRLQDQDRWTKVLPVIEKALAQVTELRAKGDNQSASAVVALVKETLRRFDERLDIEQYLPAPKEGEDGQGAPDPMQDPRVQQIGQQMQQQIQELTQQVQDLEAQLKSKADEAQATVAVGQANAQRDVEVAQINARRDIEVAKVTAPIEAEAKIIVARIQAEAAPANDTLPAATPLPDVPPIEPLETEPIEQLAPGGDMQPGPM